MLCTDQCTLVYILYTNYIDLFIHLFIQLLMYSFIYFIFTEVGSNHPCLWALHQMFALWSSTSSLMSQLLIENGLMSGVLVELQALSSCPCSEVNYNSSQLYGACGKHGLAAIESP